MKREEVYERLNGVFREVFDDEKITIHDETTSENIEGWDSLEHINLMLAVENEFEIHFNMGEINKMKNVGEMVNIILERVQ